MLLQSVLQPANAVGQPLLVAGQAPQRVARGFSLSELRDLRRNLTLCVRQLPGLELHFADRAAALVGTLRFEPPLKLPQLLERATSAGARLPRILPAQIARGIAHLLGHVAHAPSTVGAAPARLALLVRLALL